MTYEEVKSYLGKDDLVSLLEGLGYPFNRQGKFDIRGEKTPSVSINPKNLKIKDFGGDFFGDIFDLLKQLHRMRPPEDLKYVMNFLGLSDDVATVPIKRKVPAYVAPQKDNPLLMSRLKTKANKHLNELRVHNGRVRDRYKYFTLEMDESKKVAALDEPFIKLFEHSYLEVDEQKIRYIFQKFVGYDSFYNCPAIILYDLHGNVVNIINYRPKKDGEVFRKYHYSKSEDVPESSYLYPFQFEMERMILKHGFAYVGEGLKNALVALVFGIPYISIESTSGVNDRLLEYLQSDRLKNISFIGAFDGDAAGETAYKKVNKVIPMENIFNFDSGLDFADYMKKENK